MKQLHGLIHYAAALAGALFSFHTATPASAAQGSPNVVVIFADDMGYGDLGCFGAKGQATPNLDRMAAEGVKFERFYVAQPVCSASRMALMTGCYPNRVGIKGALGPGAKVGISKEETTLAELVKQNGYATAAFGKWHLGDAPQFLPVHHGFDEYLGLPYSNDMWPYHPELVNLNPEQRKKRRGFPVLPLVDGDRIVLPEVTAVEQPRLTTWYTQRAVKFINANKEKPFLLYLAHSMPHVPLFVSDKYQGKSANGVYGDVIEEIDWSVGEVLKALKENGLDEKTLVIFTSDNGPWLSYGTHSGSAGPLREGKGTVWEGGVREPFVARWPGKIPSGKVVTEPAMTIDILPTVAALTGSQLPDHKIDGRDIWPLLSATDGAKNPHEAYYFYYNDNELQAVMKGRWKLYLPHSYRTLNGRPGGKGGVPALYEQRKLEKQELYDLVSDIAERTDVAAANPEVVAELEKLAEGMRADLGDSLTQRAPSGARLPGKVE
ncbi:sulfatase [Verrucomicrobium sp. BvORR034]|uniref:sulfatase family protein n=1 Tax=Verrucomicrobium sp. BvORR034 TaxID=1396418 RepID=UPI00067906DA|nr:sulfatase [Verrucomicrobium sp. BvORR034]